MSTSNGMDIIHLQQFRAIAGNLYTQANSHREDHDYVVASALYGRALTVAQGIQSLAADGNVLVNRIRTDQEAVSAMLSSRC